jgi:hypothetical protein
MGGSKSRHKEYNRGKLAKEGCIMKTGKFLAPNIEQTLKTRWFKMTDRELQYYTYYQGGSGDLKNRASFDRNFKLIVEDKANREAVVELVNWQGKK